MTKAALRAASCCGIILGAIALLAMPSGGAAPPPPDACNVTTPTTAITPALLSSGLPCAGTITAPFTLDNIQHGFDYYSWLTFLALNAPSIQLRDR